MRNKAIQDLKEYFCGYKVGIFSTPSELRKRLGVAEKESFIGGTGRGYWGQRSTALSSAIDKKALREEARRGPRAKQ